MKRILYFSLTIAAVVLVVIVLLNVAEKNRIMQRERGFEHDAFKNKYDSLYLDAIVLKQYDQEITISKDSLKKKIFHLYDNNVQQLIFKKDNIILKGYSPINEFAERFPVSYKGRMTYESSNKGSRSKEVMKIQNKDPKGELKELQVSFCGGYICDIAIH